MFNKNNNASIFDIRKYDISAILLKHDIKEPSVLVM